MSTDDMSTWSSAEKGTWLGVPSGVDLETIPAKWERLPLFVEGRSVEIRSLAEGVGVCRFKNTVYSKHSPREGEIPGTGQLRMRIHRALVELLAAHGIHSSYRAFVGDMAVVQLVRVPPIEVIVKTALVGTPLTRYRDIEAVPTRFGGFLSRGAAHPPYVRFDWRNRYPVQDEVIPAGLADYFIDTQQAEKTAQAAFSVLEEFFAGLGLKVLDMVFTMDETGTVLTSELSPEAMRLKRAADEGSYDADLWRQNTSPEVVISRLRELSELVEAALRTRSPGDL